MVNFIHIAKNAGTSIKELIDRRELALVYHDHWENPTFIEDSMIILREPFDRFISAYYYLSTSYEEKRMISNIISSPNVLAEGLHDNLPEAVKFAHRENHYIGNDNFSMDWAFVPQCKWVHTPKYVLFREFLDDDFREFLEMINHPPVKIPRLNKSHRKDAEFTEKSISFIRNFYDEDFKLREKYKNGRNI